MGTLGTQQHCDQFPQPFSGVPRLTSSFSCRDEVDEAIHKKARQIGWELKEVSKAPGKPSRRVVCGFVFACVHAQVHV